MSTIINASTSSGLVQTADTSGTLVLQSNGTSAAAVSGSNLQCDSGYGSLATVYGCRAWVNFDCTRNVTNTGASTNGQPVYIKGSGNVSSVVKNAAGDFTVNFTNAMPDANYAWVGTTDNYANALATAGALVVEEDSTNPHTSSSIRLKVHRNGVGWVDNTFVAVAVFR